MTFGQPASRWKLCDLEDFGAEALPPPLSDFPSHDIEKEEEGEEQHTLPEQLLMSEAELDTLRETAFQEGYKKATQECTTALEAKYTADIAHLTDVFAQENQRCKQIIQDSADAFVTTVVDIVKALTALDRNVLKGIQRDLTTEAAAFVAACEGDILIKCSQEDTQRLQSLLSTHANIHIETEDNDTTSTDHGLIHVTSETHTITIDREQWRQAVAEKIVAAVTALTEHRKDNTQQTP
ncbi:MAG: hypothetical protein J6P29_01270 [Acetobacter sp.]|nr:hypothetical protein [Acetobacter sp.]